MKKNIVKMSLAVVMLLSTGAYAGKIIGADISGPDPVPAWEPNTQFGFGGWDLSRSVTVYITDLDYNPIDNLFSEEFGTYDDMKIGDSFESELWAGGEIRGLLHGKDWPVGEPAGIKIINGDTIKNGKPGNCIMTTSYLSADKNGGVDGLLNTTEDAGPAPVICTSPFQSHKRFKVNMQETTVADYNTTTGYGQPFYLAFNLEEGDISEQRYQVFQKINNYTGMRLDGYKIEVLDGSLNVDENLTFSLGLGEDPQGQDSNKDDNIWDPEDMANFSHGLWGPETFEDPVPHFPTDGFFDKTRAGFLVNGHDTSTLVGGPLTLDEVAENNYDNLFGLWLPSKWAPIGIFHDHDNDPLTDANLVAFWGTIPDAPRGTLPAWHKGKDYDLSDGDQSWAEPTLEELLTWYSDPLYDTGHIEDTLNLGLNYIVNIGDNTQIDGSRVVLRFTPRVAQDQTPPNYIMDDNETYIMPVTDYNGTEAVLVISPAPYFDLNASLSVGLADTNVTGATPDVNDTVLIVITTTSGDEENLTLTETDVNSSIFVGTIGSDTNAVVVQDGTVSVVNETVVTATYGALTATTTATDGTVTPPVTPPNPSSGGGGGCTYNPNSKNFDMTFLMLMALGMLYPFRRRFLK